MLYFKNRLTLLGATRSEALFVSKGEGSLLAQKRNNGPGFRKTDDQTRIQAYELPRHMQGGGEVFSRAEAWPEEVR